MKYLEEFRDVALARTLVEEIHRVTTRPCTLMEVCGGQTHAIVKYGLDELLPAGVTLLHGPGCPVCVTSPELIDASLALARRPEITFCSFGDMLRVPGTREDLLHVKADGGDVRIVYSPLDAVKLAAREPDREVVFFAVGFETTAPATALAVAQAARLGLNNFSLLVAHVLVPPALEALLAAPDGGIQGFLAAGHVCAVTGYRHYESLATRFRVPLVVTGFEPVDLLRGILDAIQQLEAGEARVTNRYARAVRPEGNVVAWNQVMEVYEVVPRRWRGLGEIPASGLGLRPAYRRFDALERFLPGSRPAVAAPECPSGLVLRGKLRPSACREFGARCTPEHPLGATMVSPEGACAAYFHYRPAPNRPPPR